MKIMIVEGDDPNRIVHRYHFGTLKGHEVNLDYLPRGTSNIEDAIHFQDEEEFVGIAAKFDIVILDGPTFDGRARQLLQLASYVDALQNSQFAGQIAIIRIPGTDSIPKVRSYEKPLDYELIAQELGL